MIKRTQIKLTEDEFIKALAKGLGVKNITYYYVPNFIRNGVIVDVEL